MLAVDILEHFTKEDGVRFLKECLRIASKSVLISTPKDFIEQEVPANPFENHRSHWTEEDLNKCGFGKFLSDPLSIIAVSDAS